MPEEQTVDDHLKQALAHLEAAINLSVELGADNPGNQKIVGKKWEEFLGQFFDYARVKGKEQRVNLLGWISFPRLRR